MTRRVFTLSLFCLLAAAAPTVPAQQTPTTEEPGYAASEQQLLEAADQIARDVAAIRGLSVKEKVQKGIKERDELRAVLVTKLAEEVSDEEIEAEAAVYKRLGVIPQDLDYKKMLLDVLTEQIAGFYDQKAKELYIMQGIPLALQRPAMAHELFHAIQDQHFDILSMQEPLSPTENGDFSLARSALIEGDATVVMFDFSLYEAGSLPRGDIKSVVDIPMLSNMLKQLAFDDLSAMEKMLGAQGGGFGATDVSDSALAKAPALFREMLMFPYFAGMRFVVVARTGRTWKDVDRIYANPPVSTEQILHPEKYFEDDQPVHLTFDPAAPSRGYDAIYDTVLGEFQVLQFLKAHLDDDATAGVAAAGWDGDRLVAWRNQERVVVAHLTAWDSTEDAREYLGALRETVAKRYPSAQEKRASGKHGESSCYTVEVRDTSEQVYAERWGDYVLYIEGVAVSHKEKGGAHALRDRIWKTRKKVPFARHLADRRAAKKAKEKATDAAE